MTTSTMPAGPAVSAGPAPARTRRGGWRAPLFIWAFAAPALLVYLTFVLVPVALAAVYSFFNWNGLSALERFIGFDNYVRAFGDPVFVGAIGHNLAIVGLSLIIQGPLAIAIALLLNRPLRGRTLIRTLIFVPYVLSEVVAGLAFRLLLPPNGPFDGILTALGWAGDKPNWLADPDLAFWTLFVVLTWKYLGFAIILFLAGLQGVPDELAEAASIDGASWWQIQRHITLPLLGPTIRIWAFLSIIGSLQLFDMVWILTGGGPINSTATMATYMVEYGNGRSQIGYGSAVAVILFVISLVIALLYQRFVLRRDLSGAITRSGG
jgi:raffinose/stachyose/melibiose transport system permease protein